MHVALTAAARHTTDMEIDGGIEGWRTHLLLCVRQNKAAGVVLCGHSSNRDSSKCEMIQATTTRPLVSGISEKFECILACGKCELCLQRISRGWTRHGVRSMPFAPTGSWIASTTLASLRPGQMELAASNAMERDEQQSTHSGNAATHAAFRKGPGLLQDEAVFQSSVQYR